MSIKNSTDVDSSRYVDSSRDVDSSRVVDSSQFIIFCNNIKLKEYYAFNKQVTNDRFWKIRDYWNKIKGDFKLELKDNNWEDEWKKLPNEVWKKLAELPEWDKSVVEKIVGFELDLDEEEKIKKKQKINSLKVIGMVKKKVDKTIL